MLSSMIALVVFALGGCALDKADKAGGADTCPAPTAALVREHVSRTGSAVRGTVERRAMLTDPATTGEGLILRVAATLAGPGAPERVAIWADLSTPDRRGLTDGATVVAFVRRHDATTTVDGEAVAAYDFGTANGLLLVEGNRVRSQCKASASEPVDAGVLDAL
jgi:hypothetical protein